MPQGNIENLIPFTERSKEEVKEINARGGINSGKARRKKRELKKLLELALSQKPTDTPDEDNYMAITVALVQRAKEGDTKAYEMIAKMVGQLPKEEIELATKTAIKININDEEEDA